MPEQPERFWAGFHLDPRRPEHARVRATDADRDHARDLFVEAYADGRLTRAELDVRTARTAAPITLGALLTLVSDLEPTRSASAEPDRSRRPPARELLVFVVCSVACVLLWSQTGRGFFWPLWVIVFTGLPPLATLVSGRRVPEGGSGRGSGRGKGHTR